MNIIDAMMMNLQLRSVDAAAFARILEADLGCQCELALMPGTRPIEIDRIGLASAQLIVLRTDQPFALRFPEHGGNMLCLIVVSGSLVIAGPRHQPCRRGDAFALSTDAPWQVSIEAGAHLCLLALPKVATNRLLERFAGRAPEATLELAAPFRSASAKGRVLASLLTATLSAAGASTLESGHTAEMLQDAMVTVLLESLPHNHSAGLKRQPVDTAPLPVRRAIDFIVAHAHGDIGVADVAAAADLSLRALQQNFQRFLNLSPQDYIKTVRLQGVRRELLDPASRRSIEEIASGWGFVNRGHFATQYRKAFGERPSETRRSR